MSVKDSEKEPTAVPAGGDAAPDLGGPGANLGTHGGTGADSGGTGAGTTALDAIGSQGNRESEVASHLRIKHTIPTKRGGADTDQS